MDEQEEEIEALRAIYGEDNVIVLTAPTEGSGCELKLRVPRNDDVLSGDEHLRVDAWIHARCGPDYPKRSPVVQVLAPWLSDAELGALQEEAAAACHDGAGQPVLFDVAERLRGAADRARDAAVDSGGRAGAGAECRAHEARLLGPEDPEPEKRAVSRAVVADAVDTPALYLGEVLTDRKSHFQAHAARVRSEAEVEAVMRTLLANGKIARATHNMMAYRIEREGGQVVADNDEDGESGAGAKMAHLLEVMDARNVVVVVSRWYGGIQLGPDRFKHINNCARLALEDSGLVSRRDARVGGRKGRKR